MRNIIATIALTTAIAAPATAEAGNASRIWGAPHDAVSVALEVSTSSPIVFRAAALGGIFGGPIVGTAVDDFTIIEDWRVGGESAVDAFWADARLDAVGRILVEQDQGELFDGIIQTLEQDYSGTYDWRVLAVQSDREQSLSYMGWQLQLDEGFDGDSELVSSREIESRLQDLESQDKLARFALGVFPIGCDAPPYVVAVHMVLPEVEDEDVDGDTHVITVVAEDVVCAE